MLDKEIIKEKVLSVLDSLGYTYGESEEEILERRFYENFDSIDLLEFIMSVEQKFNITFDDSLIYDKIEEIKTIEDFIYWIHKNYNQ